MPHVRIIAVLAAAYLTHSPLPAGASPCVALGDSLTFAYEAEFGFQFTIPFVGTYGDGFGPEVRNWVEILGDPAYRGGHFDFGARNTFELDLIFTRPRLLFRHEYNWALPGLRIHELRDFLENTLTFADLASVDPVLSLLLGFSDLDPSTAFELADLQDQIRETADRLLLFIGGNDVRPVYGSIYNGASPAAFLDSFTADAEAILDIIQGLNPQLPVVLVSVPHIGITPDIKQGYPTDAVKTGRVTDTLRELNRRLKGLAEERGYGFADVFTPTLPMLQSAPFSIQGIPFANSGSTTGDLDFLWLNGQYSANFHPNTHGQAVIANEIIRAFNKYYGTGIAPLTATEILGELLGKSPQEIDMSFASWMASYGLGGFGGEDDSDGDGLPARVEFALGLNPLLRDACAVSSGVRETVGGRVLELAYPLRLTNSSQFTLVPAHSPDLITPFTPIMPAPMPGPDGLARAWLVIEPSGSGFLRLESIPPNP